MARPARTSADDILALDPELKSNILRRLQVLSNHLRLSHDHLVLQSDLIERNRCGRSGLSRKTIQRMRHISSEDLDRIALGENVRGAPDSLSISRAARLVAEIERNSQLSGRGMADWYLPIAASMQLDNAGQQEALQRYIGFYKCYALTPDSRQLSVTGISINRNEDGQPRFQRYERVVNNEQGAQIELCDEGHMFFVGEGMLLVSLTGGVMRQLLVRPSSDDGLRHGNGLLFSVKLPDWIPYAVRISVEQISADPSPAIVAEDLGLFEPSDERYWEIRTSLETTPGLTTLAAFETALLPTRN